MSSLSQGAARDQARSILTFTGELLHHTTQSIPLGHLEIPDSVIRSLDCHLSELPSSSITLSGSTRRRLDSSGVELWNVCIQLVSSTQQKEGLGVLTKLRIFAFLILESAAPRRGSANHRILDIAFKVARMCLGNRFLDYSLKVLEIAAARLAAVEKLRPDFDSLVTRSMSTEYYMLRAHLAWLQGRCDIAEHLFSKAPEASSLEDARIIFETCFRIEKAVDASDVLSGQTDPSLKDMKLHALYHFVRANACLGTVNSEHRLTKVMTVLKEEYETVLSASILRLEILSEDDKNCQEYFEVLQAAVQAIDVTDQSIELVLYHVQKLKGWSLEYAVETLKKLLIERLAPSGERALVERSLLTLIWMLTSSGTPPHSFLRVTTEVIKRLSELGHGPVSEEVAHASLMPIWRNMVTASSNSSVQESEEWCHLVLEQLMFQNCSQANRAKFQRRAIALALEASNTLSARRMLDHMDESWRSEPLTLYLTYKLALLDEDSQLSSECIGKLEMIGVESLLPCAVEAQQLGKKQQAIAVIQRIVTSLKNCENASYIILTLRPVIYILFKELEVCETTLVTELLGEICDAFEAALSNAGNSPDRGMFSKELFQHVYTLALKLLSSNYSTHVIRLLDISAKIVEMCQQNYGLEDQTDLLEYALLCSFLKVIRCASNARIQSDIVEKRASYELLRGAAQTFRAKLLPYSHDHAEDWNEKLRIVISLDFEAAARLHQWTSLPPMIEEAQGIATEKLSTLFIDIILCSEAPIQEVLRTFKLIICTNFKSFGGAQLPRYLRCLFQLALGSSASAHPSTHVHSGGDHITIAEAVLDQVLALFRSSELKGPSSLSTPALALASRPGPEHPYPVDELRWLATAAFNRAVDFFRDSEDRKCKRWASKAIELAELADRRSSCGGHGLELSPILRRNLKLLRME